MRSSTSFKKGKPKTGGRKKGVSNKISREIKELWRSILIDAAYQADLRTRVVGGDAPSLELYGHQLLGGRPKPSEEESGSLDSLVDVLKAVLEHE